MMNTRRMIAASAILATALTTTACGGSEKATTGAADGKKINVVTSFYDLQFIAERVGGSHTDVTTLTQPGQEPHDLELTPKQIGSLGEAKLMVYIGKFQTAVDDAVKESKPANVLDAGSLVTMMKASEAEEHDHEAEHGDHDHEAEHKDGSASPAASHKEEHSEEGHDHGGIDPHIWLDPTNMVKVTEGVKAKLSEIDPDHKADYEANAKKLTDELTSLDESFKTGLKACERKEFITSHAAFGYLAKAYGLTQIGISGLSPDEQPSPARIAEVQKLAKEHGVTTIFYETLVSPAVAKSIAGDLKLKAEVLDPIEGITPESKGKNYIEVMQSNLAALKSANGCK